MSAAQDTGRQILTRKPSRNTAITIFPAEVVPPSLKSIVPILRVASEIEHERPRVAFLCWYYAFEKACRLDPKSTGAGVRQFKLGLMQRLDWKNASSRANRVEKTDTCEIESYYQHYYSQNIRALDQGEQADRAQLGKAYQTAGVLFEVLCGTNSREKAALEVPKNNAVKRDVEGRQNIHAPHNILPVYEAGSSQSIMQLEKIMLLQEMSKRSGTYIPKYNVLPPDAAGASQSIMQLKEDIIRREISKKRSGGLSIVLVMLISIVGVSIGYFLKRT